jgi:hypothetical protein
MKACPSYPGYSVTENGEVFTHRRRRGAGKGHGGTVTIDPTFTKQLKAGIRHGGYEYVSVSTSRGQRSIPVHVLLMDAFHGPRTDGMEVRHLDGNCRNNALTNLAYGTPRENSEDARRHGTIPMGEAHHKAKLTADMVREIRRLAAEGVGATALSLQFSVSRGAIYGVVSGRKWRHV